MMMHELVEQAKKEDRWPLVIRRPHWDDCIQANNFGAEWTWQRHGVHYFGKPKDDIADDFELVAVKLKHYVNIRSDGTWTAYKSWGEAEQAAREHPCEMVGVEVWLER